MPRITAIKPQKNNKRVNIYLDGKFGFGLDLENFVKLGLKVGRQISQEEVEKIVRVAEFQKTLDKLLRFAMLRPRSRKEIKDWFYRKKVPESLQNELLDKLKHFELIDDEKFAGWWIGQRKQFKFKSKRELVQELRTKGIDKDIVNKVIGEQVNQENEIENAKRLLEKRMYKWKSLDEFTRKRKMSEFLGRKGFGWETIKEVLKELLSK